MVIYNNIRYIQDQIKSLLERNHKNLNRERNSSLPDEKKNGGI